MRCMIPRAHRCSRSFHLIKRLRSIWALGTLNRAPRAGEINAKRDQVGSLGERPSAFELSAPTPGVERSRELAMADRAAMAKGKTFSCDNQKSVLYLCHSPDSTCA